MSSCTWGEPIENITIDQVVVILKNKGYDCYHMTRNNGWDRIDFKDKDIDTYITLYKGSKDRKPFLDMKWSENSPAIMRYILSFFGGKILENDHSYYMEEEFVIKTFNNQITKK